MATESQPLKQCPRCAANIPNTVGSCPNCGLLLQPGVVFFDPTHAESVQGVESGTGDRPYERRTISCLPMDLERVARAEAVDGWSLTDTTVDPGAPGNILANFRRPVRSAARSGEAQRAPDTKQTKRAAKAAKTPARKTSQSSAPRPSFGEGPNPSPAIRNVLTALLVVGAIVFLADNFGIPGLVLGLIFVPGIVRSLLGDKWRRRRR